MHNNSLTNYLKAQKSLKLHSQGLLLDALTSLLKEEQESLLQDILHLDFNQLRVQEELLSQDPPLPDCIEPFDSFSYSGSQESSQIGLEAASLGECGALLIAGGQGTRLGHPGPKGTFPITPVYHKSLFQFFCEKVLLASQKAGRDLPLAIMTSPLNDELTKRFFARHQNFGLKQEQLFFFSQTMLPFLDFDGHLFLEDRASIAKGPDGNGSCFKEFADQGLLNQFKSMGVKYLNVILVDNPLADPYDFELFGHLIKTKSDLTLKSCQRLSSKEKVGVIVSQGHKPIVVEYHELPKGFSFEKEPAANLSLFALTLDFAHAASELELPLHKVAKKSNRFDIETQSLYTPLKPNCWKFERYIFDIFPQSSKTTILTYPRSQIFCPLKNREGAFGPSEVRESLLSLGIR